jgi:hypothetical protein
MKYLRYHAIDCVTLRSKTLLCLFCLNNRKRGNSEKNEQMIRRGGPMTPQERELIFRIF